MCTAINDTSKFHLFGRTLDLDCSYDEAVVITPRNFKFSFIHKETADKHHAIIGTAHIEGGTPLYYDGVNEKGLFAAALRFPELCHYHEKAEGKINLASFEIIPWILSQFDSAAAAKKALRDVNITSDNFSRELPSAPLHWLIGDKKASFVIESRDDGLHIYDNEHGVLTNAPDFPTQCFVLDKFGDPPLGDLSSSARFIRAVHAKKFTLEANDKDCAISRIFHILGTVNHPHGLFRADEKHLKTVYTSCIDPENMTYYYTTYDCRQIHAVRLDKSHSDGSEILAFPMCHKENIEYAN